MILHARRPFALIVGVALIVASCGTAERPLRFSEVAQDRGISFTHGAFNWDIAPDPAAMMGGGVCWLDIENDGWMDLFVVNSYAEAEFGEWQSAGGLPTYALFSNDEGRFTAVSEGAGVAITGRGNGCVAADLDGNGYADILVTTARSDNLFWNNGDGTFTEAAAGAGVDGYGWTTGAAAGDLNGDGFLDLVVAGYVDLNNENTASNESFPGRFFAVQDRVYLNNGDRTFVEVSEQLGLEASGREYGLGTVLEDLDGDGDLDLYIANDTDPNRLYLNEQDDSAIGFRLNEVAEQRGADDGNSGMGVAVTDLDTDGLSDLIVTNFGDQLHAILRLNDTRTSYTDVAASFGIDAPGVGQTGWGIVSADFDQDGDLDLLIANGEVPMTAMDVGRQPVEFYRNNGGPGTFSRDSEIVGLGAASVFHARGAAGADFDNDGDIDVAVTTIGGDLLLFENMIEGANWIAVGSGDVLAPGTRVVVTRADGLRLQRTVRAGSSYLSSEDPRAYFGLGDIDDPVTVSITSPSGVTTTYPDVPINQIYRSGT
jgi:VCBS repeat protein/ASPIC/UnbV protein